MNLGADDPVTLKATAELMIAAHGSGNYSIVPFPPEKKIIDIGDYYADYRKIRSKLGWKPKVALEEGLRKTLAYFKEHLNPYL